VSKTRVERFLDEVEGPFVDGPDEGFIGLLGVAGHQDRLNIGLGGLQGPRDLESVHGRKPDVDDRQVGPQRSCLLERRPARRRRDNLMPAPQDARDGAKDSWIVIDDQDAGSLRLRGHGQAPACGIGKTARTRVPAPGVLSIWNCPRSCATIDRQIARPSP
jgi:hypothetical protein